MNGIISDFQFYLNMILEGIFGYYLQTKDDILSLKNVDSYQNYWDNNRLSISDSALLNIKRWPTEFNIDTPLFTDNLKSMKLIRRDRLDGIYVDGTGNGDIISYRDFIDGVYEIRNHDSKHSMKDVEMEINRITIDPTKNQMILNLEFYYCKL